MGLAVAGFGIFPILIAFGVVTAGDAHTTAPTWVVVCAGLSFVAGGLTIIVNYGVAGAGADGRLRPDTPIAIRAVSVLTSLAIVGLLTAVSAWVVFGPVTVWP